MCIPCGVYVCHNKIAGTSSEILGLASKSGVISTKCFTYSKWNVCG